MINILFFIIIIIMRNYQYFIFIIFISNMVYKKN
jgi:hypothetical protein